MYCISDIRHVHLEISSRCNAACPLCPRNLYGYPFNDGYTEHDMTLEEAQKIFPRQFVSQLTEIYINGNFGDIVMNEQATDIVSWFRDCSPTMMIKISTNGGARNSAFWKKLAELKTQVMFCIDGLEDTHSLYRQNTVYETVLKNAKTFIAAGGKAIWKMVKFDHNQHQHSVAKQLSYDLGFVDFQLVDHGRNTAPVFDKHGHLTHTIGKPTETKFEKILWNRSNDEVLLEDIVAHRKPKTIECHVKKKKSLYVSSTGLIYPCCFLGFNPKTYGHGNYHQAANRQFAHMVDRNNAIQYPLEECIMWFNQIQDSWNRPSFQQGRLVICNDVCGTTVLDNRQYS
jgi:MoaA/NifB/PqqE/SkfB family radical SAM enzyme